MYGERRGRKDHLDHLGKMDKMVDKEQRDSRSHIRHFYCVGSFHSLVTNTHTGKSRYDRNTGNSRKRWRPCKLDYLHIIDMSLTRAVWSRDGMANRDLLVEEETQEHQESPVKEDHLVLLVHLDTQ